MAVQQQSTNINVIQQVQQTQSPVMQMQSPVMQAQPMSAPMGMPACVQHASERKPRFNSSSFSQQTLCGCVCVAHRREGMYAQPSASQNFAPQAMPQPVVAAAYECENPAANATMVVPAAGKHDMGNGQPVGLSQALSANNLAQYEDALRALGVVSLTDVQDLEEADCRDMGMKPLEFKRLLRSAGQMATTV